MLNETKSGFCTWTGANVWNCNKLYGGCILSTFIENAHYWINKSNNTRNSLIILLPFTVEILLIDWKSGEKQDLHREHRGHISTPAFSY